MSGNTSQWKELKKKKKKKQRKNINNILYSTQIFFTNESKIKTFADK